MKNILFKEGDIMEMERRQRKKLNDYLLVAKGNEKGSLKSRQTITIF